jgi:acyl carrier protein
MDAAQIGVERTMDILRELLAQRFGLELPKNGKADAPLFAVGAGLSSLEGIEFLCELEKIFGLEIKDLDWWVYETPTLAAVAQHLVDLANEKRQHAT